MCLRCSPSHRWSLSFASHVLVSPNCRDDCKYHRRSCLRFVDDGVLVCSKYGISQFSVAHITCAQMFVCWSQYCTVRFCVRSVFPHQNRHIRHATHPMLPSGSSTQFDVVPPVPSRALPAVCLLGCHRPPTCVGYPPVVGFFLLCLWAVVTATGLVPLTTVGFTRELWWCWWTLHYACLWPG